MIDDLIIPDTGSINATSKISGNWIMINIEINNIKINCIDNNLIAYSDTEKRSELCDLNEYLEAAGSLCNVEMNNDNNLNVQIYIPINES